MPSFRGLIKAFIALGVFAAVVFVGGSRLLDDAPPPDGVAVDVAAPSGESAASAARSVGPPPGAPPSPSKVAEDLDPAMLGVKATPAFANLDSSLDAIATGVRKGGDALRDAIANAPLTDGDAVAVSVRAQSDISDARGFLESNGVPIDYSGRTWLEAYVPADLLGALSERSDVIGVSPIMPAVTTQTAPAAQCITDLGTLSADVTRSGTWSADCGALFYEFTTAGATIVNISATSPDITFISVQTLSGSSTGSVLEAREPSSATVADWRYIFDAGSSYAIRVGGDPAPTSGSFTLTLDYRGEIGPDCMTDLGTLDSDNLTANNHRWSADCPSVRLDDRLAKYYKFTVAAGEHRFMSASVPDGDNAQLYLAKGASVAGTDYVAGFDPPDLIPGYDNAPEAKIIETDHKVEWFLGEGDYVIEVAAKNSPAYPETFSLTIDPSNLSSTTVANCRHEFGSRGRGTFYAKGNWSSCTSATDNEYAAIRPTTRSLVTVDFFPYDFSQTVELTFRNDTGATYTGGTAPVVAGKTSHAMALRTWSSSMPSRRHFLFPIAQPKVQTGDYGMRITVSAVPTGTTGGANSNVLPPATATPIPTVAVCTGSSNVHDFGTIGAAAATHNGALANTCGSRNRPGAYGKLHELTVTAARPNVTVTSTSSAANLYMYLMKGSVADGGDVVAQDDDSGSGVNALLESVALEAGTYTLEVTSNGLADAGSYSLVVSALPDAAAPTAEAVTSVCAQKNLTEIHGSLTRSGTWKETCESEETSHTDAETGKRLHADYYTFNLPVRSFVSIDANAGGASPRLYLRRDGRRSGEKIAEDSDAANPNLARVRQVLDAGSYTIEAAQPDDDDLANAYDLTIGVANVETGCSVSLGTLGALDGGWARAGSGSRCRYTFTLSEGARASFSALSGSSKTLALSANSRNENPIADYAKSVRANSPDWSETVWLPKGGYTLTASGGSGAFTVAAALSPPIEGGAPAVHNVPEWREHGYTGDGVKIAVVDSGFRGYGALVGVEVPEPAGELCADSAPADCLSAAVSGDSHGASVAEAIYDIAPDADIYLTQATTPGALAASVDWMLSNEVDVANMSLAFPWDSAPNGDTSAENAVSRSIAKATRGGVTWISSAGNNARTSWRGAFADADTDDLIEFATDDETNAVVIETAGRYAFEMRWEDSWGSSARDLDLYLVDGDNRVVAKSENYQSGDDGDNPREAITALLAPGEYRLVARQASGTDPDWVQIREIGGALPLEHPEPASLGSSVANPAELGNQALVAVGAAPYYDTASVAPYSGRGPTADGRSGKPDVVGAEADLSAAAGEIPFAGSSQAAPHVAGLAALVKQKYPDAPPVRLARYLRDFSETRAPAAEWGSGLARLHAAELDSAGETLSVSSRDVLKYGARAGYSVDIADNGSMAVYGAPGPNDRSGYVYLHVSSAWSSAGAALIPSVALPPDGYGEAVAMSGNGSVVAAGAPTFETSGASSGSVFIFTKPSGAWADANTSVTLDATSADANEGDLFGASVSVSADGTHIAVGAPGDEDGKGAVYIFTRSGGTWSTSSAPTAKLTITGAAEGDAFGTSVSISGQDSTVVAGAPGENGGAGAAYVFAATGSPLTWPTSPSAKLTNARGAAGDRFGYSVSASASGDEIAVGAPADAHGGTGAAHVFIKGTSWSARTAPTTLLLPSDGAYGDQFGHSVSIGSSGTSVGVGAPSAFGGGGAIYKFTRGTSWSAAPRSAAALRGSSSAVLGMGFAVAVRNDGTSMAYGTPWRADGAGGAFVRTDGMPATYARLYTTSTFDESDAFGASTAISGDKSAAVVGASGARAVGFTAGNYLDGGVAFVFSGAGDTTPAKLAPGSDGQAVRFGTSVAVSGDAGVIAVAALPAVTGSTGAVYVFSKPASGWGGGVISGGWAKLRGPAALEQYGNSLAISRDGSVIAVGATGASSTNQQGGAYVYVRPDGGWGSAQLSDSDSALITTGQSDSHAGYAVAVSANGDTVALGAPIEYGTPGSLGTLGAGAAYVFTRPSAGWGTNVTITDNAHVTVREGTGAELLDRMGTSVALSDDGGLLFVGAPREGDNDGAVYVFERPNAGWGTSAIASTDPASPLYARKITPGDGAKGGRFGASMSASANGKRLLIGAPDRDKSFHSRAGAAYVFDAPADSKGGWTATSTPRMTAALAARSPDVNGARSRAGATVSLSEDGTGAIVGAPYYDQAKGAAYLYNLSGAPAKPTVSVSSTRSAVSTSAGRFMRFPVSLSAGGDERVTVEYRTTAGGSADAGSDYAAARGTVSFAPGETSKTARVRLLSGVRAGETLTIALSSPVNAKLGVWTATGTAPQPPRDPSGGNGGSSGPGGGTGSARIGLSTTSLSFGVDLDGEIRASRTIEVWNTGGGRLSFTVSSSDRWLTASPSSEVSTGRNDRESVRVTANAEGLSEGRYSGTLTIRASGATPKTVSVRLDVTRSESERQPVAPPVVVAPAPPVAATPGTTPAPAATPAPQRISTPDGTIHLIVPAGATDQPVEISVRRRDAADLDGSPPAGERVARAVSLDTYARGGGEPVEITYRERVDLRFSMPSGFEMACADGRARIYRVSDAGVWTPLSHHCETDGAGAVYAVVSLNRFSEYALTIAQAAPPTATPTAVPTPVPTATPEPTPMPTATPEPTTPPMPTATATAWIPTATPVPPTTTPAPPTPTATPVPPTATPAPPATSVPPTATPPIIVAQATATAVPATATAVPPPATAVPEPTSTAVPPPAPEPETTGGGANIALIAIIAIAVLAAIGGGAYIALRRGMLNFG